MGKYLVTGGAGFIGKRLIDNLISQGNNQIISLDNLFTGYYDKLHDSVSYIEAHTKDILNLDLPFVPEIVFHLGEYSRIATSFEDVQKVFEFNIHGTYNVLEFCKLNRCKLIYAGSSSKFGNDGKDENLSPYSWTKSKNVELIKNYGCWFDLDFAITYFYNVYGPGHISTGKYSTVIGIFEEQYKKGTPLTVVKPGIQKRVFTHIDDIIAGLIIAAEKGKGDGYCFGDKNSAYTIEETARMFSDNITYITEQKGNRNMSVLDTKKSENELGWHPKNDLKGYINNFKMEVGS
tara:strand:- start:3312 stop:4184 length:873 start_codon:yes stop_codon:yes gene_type:complete